MHRFSLENTRPTKLFRCPQCGKKTFKRYRDNELNEYLGDDVGRCNREVNCGYHFKPREYFAKHPDAGKTGCFAIRVTRAVGNSAAKRRNPFSVQRVQLPAHMNKLNNLNSTTQANVNGLPDTILPSPFGRGADFACGKPTATEGVEVTGISHDILKASLAQYHRNPFTQYLTKLFGEEVTRKLIDKYYIGTAKFKGGATIFWQVDSSNRVRNGKVMTYTAATGKRGKTFTWAHCLLELPNYTLTHCLYGEHLLHHDKDKPIAVAEGEKTAIVASVYLPQFIWMATGSLQNMSVERMLPLKGRNIILYPDLLPAGAADKWAQVTQQLQAMGFNIRINRLLEKIATTDDHENGLDVADYLIRISPPLPLVLNKNTGTPFIHPDAVEPLKKMIAKNPLLQKLIDKVGIARIDLVK